MKQAARNVSDDGVYRTTCPPEPMALEPAKETPLQRVLYLLKIPFPVVLHVLLVIFLPGWWLVLTTIGHIVMTVVAIIIVSEVDDMTVREQVLEVAWCGVYVPLRLYCLIAGLLKKLVAWIRYG